MDTEEFAVFDRLESMATIRALESERGNDFFPGYKSLSADLALKLATATGVVVNILVWRAVERAYGMGGNCARFVFVGFDRHYRLTIAEPVIFIPEKPVLFDEWFDNGEVIGKELLVFGAVEFIVSPLLERDISADEENKPANLAILFLNDVK